MEWVILFAILATYSILSSKLDKIIKMQESNNKKEFPSLESLVGKNISLQMDDEFEVNIRYKKEGTLKEFDEKWLVIEANNKELYYYRINDIISIDILDKEQT